jgi:Skp family chaperone for outer membrane proteins
MRRADLLGMATYRIPRAVLVLGALSLTLAAPARGTATEPIDGRAPTVAYYDADAVLGATRTFAAEQSRLDRLAERYAADAAPLQAEVDELRARLRQSVGWSEAVRRALQTQLAARTIALLVRRAEGARELAQVRHAQLAGAEQRIVATVARVAGERALAVVVRTNASTRVLDENAIDLTPLVIAALDGQPSAPPRSEPGERRRLRIQSWAAIEPIGTGPSVKPKASGRAQRAG